MVVNTDKWFSKVPVDMNVSASRIRQLNMSMSMKECLPIEESYKSLFEPQFEAMPGNKISMD